jgi:hypothetical protein
MSQENLTYYSSKRIDGSWTEYLFRQACKSFAEEQAKNEEWYLKAILGLNKGGKYLEEKVKKIVRGWGDRNKDLLYPFWTEEDLRLGIARHLYQRGEKRCVVHGQVYLKKRYRRNGKKAKQRFPDLYFIVKKEKEREEDAVEKNVESGAVEIKSCKMDQNLYSVRKDIVADLKKLLSYCYHGLKPHANTGFFICVDESGYAKDILEELFHKKIFKRKNLAYAVITPAYTREVRHFPRKYEDLDQDKRKLKYLMDTVLGRLSCEMDCYKPYQISNGSDGSFHFYLKGNLKIGSAWAGIIFKEYSVYSKPQKYSVVIQVNEEAHLGRGKPVRWDYDKNRYVYTEKNNLTREYMGISNRKLEDLDTMKEISAEIVRIVKQMHKREERLV